MAINSVVIAGNLVGDIETRTTATGFVVGRFTVAVNERVKRNGEWEDYANFFDCTLFGDRANKLAPYMGKGSKVAVSGRLHQDRYEKDGQKRSRIGIIADQIEFMSGRTEKASAAPEYYDEDLPF